MNLKMLKTMAYCMHDCYRATKTSNHCSRSEIQFGKIEMWVLNFKVEYISIC